MGGRAGPLCCGAISRGEARTQYCRFYSAVGVCVSLKSPAQLSASSSDMPTEAPSRLRLRRPERPEKLLTGPPRLDRTIKGEKKAKLSDVVRSR